LDRLLLRIRGLLAPNGQVFLDSLDVRRTQDPQHLTYQDTDRQVGRYVERFDATSSMVSTVARTSASCTWIQTRLRIMLQEPA